MIIDPDNPTSFDAYNRIDHELETVWQSALAAFRCVECARLELAQRLRGLAEEKNIEIMGGDAWINSEKASVETAPMEREGVRRICKDCQEPPPPGSIQFFKHGTDELIK